MSKENLKDEDVKEESEAEKKVAKEEKNEKKAKKQDKKSESIKKEIDEQKAQFDELNDKYLRMMAEYENFRRRAQKERESAYSDAYADAVKEILPIIDNLERAASYKDNDKVSEGVTMTLNQFKATLEKLGVSEIEAAPGLKFDPNFHNAVMHAEDENFGENEITEVFQKGYIKGDRVIRYTMVKVAN